MLSLAAAGVAFAAAAACTPGRNGLAQIDVADASDIIRSLRAQLFACWNPPAGAVGVNSPVAIVRIRLNQDGSLSGKPVLVNSGSSPSQALAESALRAIRLCQPFKLPVAKYDVWRDVEIAFDARARNLR